MQFGFGDVNNVYTLRVTYIYVDVQSVVVMIEKSLLEKKGSGRILRETLESVVVKRVLNEERESEDKDEDRHVNLMIVWFVEKVGRYSLIGWFVERK